MSSFTHLDDKDRPNMVDVGDKTISRRVAVAQSIVALPKAVRKHLEGDDIRTKKGAVFQTAILAGIMAAKRTSALIPLCHPLPLDKIEIDIKMVGKNAVIEAAVATSARTGVEMEALTAASIAALTIYDMCKAFSHDIRIRETQLMAKSGGKRDFKRA
ncbi:MAG: cyclic pyranopterin monophosphate synthase MoaC [Saprospiraceae bacterium]|nr:cyclic pyranopterin monophosphate synthase MoaC [Saprospiraceae bacterium]